MNVIDTECNVKSSYACLSTLKEVCGILCLCVFVHVALQATPLPLGQQYGIFTHSNAFLPPLSPWLRTAYHSLSAVVLCIILYLLLSVSVLGRVRPEVYCFPETMHYRVLFL